MYAKKILNVKFIYT